MESIVPSQLHGHSSTRHNPDLSAASTRGEPSPRAAAQQPLWRWAAAHRSGLVLAGDAAMAFAALTLVAGPAALRPAVALAVVALTVLLLAQGGFYRPRLRMSVLADLPGIVGRCFIAGALASVALPPGQESVVRAVTSGAACATAVVVARSAAYGVIRWMRVSRRIAHRTLILGNGAVASELGAALLSRPEHGLLPVGFLDSGLYAATPSPLPLLGEIADLARAVLMNDIRIVIVAFSSGREVEQVEVLRACDRLAVDIFVVPRFFEVHTVGRDMEAVWGIPLARLRRAAFRSFSWKLKRLMDVVLSGLAIVVLAPVLIACALAARAETGGFFFRQTRVGLDGRHFEMLKFQSMKPVDEADAHRNWSIGSDPRVGTVGRFMRRLSLDELPQLFNVLRGDMTLVGPRPERTYFVELLAGQFPRYMARHRVPAGLTGWAQVNGLRGDTSIHDRVRFDNYYIENWSFWLDVQILARTFAQVLRGSGR
jgi:exopolysaccharide biosynthesis polyprenyl glycosylphosphotransferase